MLKTWDQNTFYKELFSVYSKDKMTEEEIEKSYSYLFNPQRFTTTMVGSGQTQEPDSSTLSSRWVAALQALSQELSCGHPKWQLCTAASHSASHKTIMVQWMVPEIGKPPQFLNSQFFQSIKQRNQSQMVENPSFLCYYLPLLKNLSGWICFICQNPLAESCQIKKRYISFHGFLLCAL